jgi:steroid delta-isomerase-like uncharacterized protein
MSTAITEQSPNLRALQGYLVEHDPSYLADDATFTDVTSGMQWTGREAIAAMLEWLYSRVFEAHVEDVRLIADPVGGLAAAELVFVGRHIGEFAGIPATNRDVRVPMVVVYELTDGRITAARVHFNVASFQAQVLA